MRECNRVSACSAGGSKSSKCSKYSFCSKKVVGFSRSGIYSSFCDFGPLWFHCFHVKIDLQLVKEFHFFCKNRKNRDALENRQNAKKNQKKSIYQSVTAICAFSPLKAPTKNAKKRVFLQERQMLWGLFFFALTWRMISFSMSVRRKKGLRAFLARAKKHVFSHFV